MQLQYYKSVKIKKNLIITGKNNYKKVYIINKYISFYKLFYFICYNNYNKLSKKN